MRFFFLLFIFSFNIFYTSINVEIKNKCTFLLNDIFKDYDDIEVEIPKKYLSYENIEITGISFSKNYKNIFVDALSKGKKIKITGNIVLLKKVPVLKNVMFKEQIIKEDDIQEILIKSSKIQNNYLLDRNSIIGMVPYGSSVRAGRPINSNKLKKPLFIKRGDIAVVVYKKGCLSLELKAKSLSDGRLGDLISFKNTNSGKTIYGTVVSKGKAEV